METKFTIPENDKPLREKTQSLRVIIIQFTSFQNYPTLPPSNLRDYIPFTTIVKQKITNYHTPNTRCTSVHNKHNRIPKIRATIT